jgi:hypothetical protein
MVLKYVKSLPECRGLQIHSHQVSANRLPYIRNYLNF